MSHPFPNLRRRWQTVRKHRAAGRAASHPKPSDNNSQRLPKTLDKEILALAIPALGALVAEPLYVLADTAVVGNLGTTQLAGLALASQSLLLIHAMFTFLAYGTTAVVARLSGAGAEGEAARWGVQGMLVAAVLGATLAGLMSVFAQDVLELLGGKDEVLSEALVYLRISLGGLPAMLMTLAGAGFLRGQLDTVRPLKVAVYTAVGNLALELVLIYGLGFGIGASALSTVLAQWAAAAAYIWWITRWALAHRVGFGLNLNLLRQMSKVGIDLLARTIVLRGAFVASTAVAARVGTAELAAHQVVFEFFNFTSLVLDAVAIAGQGMVGKLLGAKDALTARAVGKRILEWGLVLGVVAATLIFVLRGVLPLVFSDDPAVIATTSFLLMHLAAMLPLGGVVFALDGVLIGAGDFRFLAWAMAASAAVYAPLLWVVSSSGAGVGWLWGTLWVFILARLASLLGRFAGASWLRLGEVK